MAKEKIYHFKVTLAGTGRNATEAWNEAVESFSMDPGATPEKGEYEIDEELEE